ncbi:MAG: cation transporter [Firmicutes bacterium]|nr:cation transporter [Bacillota bacterium]
MEKLRSVLKKIFFLKPLPTVLIAVPSFILVFCVLGMEIDGAVAYISYGLSAYALAITVTGFPQIVKALKKRVDNHPLVKKLLAHPLGGRYLTDTAFRAEISLYPSFCINIVYAAIKMFSGIKYGSVWFISLGVYYILLAVMRLLLLTSARKKQIKNDAAAEYKRYCSCGGLLVIMTLALSGIILFIIRREGDYDYPGLLIYVMAVYAFYAVITAAINIVKFRKKGSPVLSAAKAINLTAALVSMLALETAMIGRFGGEDSQDFQRLMMTISGAVVCAFVLGMGVYMLVNGGKRLKNLIRK